jgi:hypothetical protein
LSSNGKHCVSRDDGWVGTFKIAIICFIFTTNWSLK